MSAYIAAIQKGTRQIWPIGKGEHEAAIIYFDPGYFDALQGTGEPPYAEPIFETAEEVEAAAKAVEQIQALTRERDELREALRRIVIQFDLDMKGAPEWDCSGAFFATIEAGRIALSPKESKK